MLILKNIQIWKEVHYRKYGFLAFVKYHIDTVGFEEPYKDEDYLQLR